MLSRRRTHSARYGMRDILVNGAVLQVMPWPLYQNMTDRQLTAIWTYLSTVPCNAHNDAVGDMYPWLKNAC